MAKLIFIFFIFSQVLQAKVINIASIDWCPQLCPQEHKDGYIIDILEELFKNSPYTLNIKSYPWTRSIAMTKRGQVLALLSPAKAEAPDLSYPKLEVGKQMMCFFTKKESKWTYKGTKSLKNLKIGIASDTSIEELNEYVKNNPKQFQYLPYSQTYIEQSIKKLQHNRFDTFLFTKNSTIYKINSLGLKKKFRIAGCVSSASIYMAFTPKENLKEEVGEVIEYFDSKMYKLKKTKVIEKIMKSYGLTLWY